MCMVSRDLNPGSFAPETCGLNTVPPRHYVKYRVITEKLGNFFKGKVREIRSVMKKSGKSHKLQENAPNCIYAFKKIVMLGLTVLLHQRKIAFGASDFWLSVVPLLFYLFICRPKEARTSQEKVGEKSGNTELAAK